MPAAKGKDTSTIVERALQCRRRADEYERMSRLEEVKCGELVKRMNAEQLREYLQRSRKKEDGPAFPEEQPAHKATP